jgi:hypothetical protein
MGLLSDWDVTPAEIDDILAASPSLRGIFFGCVAEYKLRTRYFSDPRLSNVRKYDNHDRTRKGDLVVTYKDVDITIEVKSLQSGTVREENGKMVARFQCDASDRRRVRLPSGRYMETACLVAGEFDVLAVNLFAFRKEWVFAFALNADLPRSEHEKYTPAQRKHLLATLMEITWPVAKPFSLELMPVLNKAVSAKRKTRRP